MCRAYSSIRPTSTSRSDSSPSPAAVQVQGIVAGDVETRSLGHETRREVHLRVPCVPGRRHHLGVGSSAVEVTVAVGVGAEQPGHVLSRHQHPERRALHLGEMAHQAQERHRRRLDRTTRHVLGIQARALHLQGESLTAHGLDQRRALVAQRRSVLTRVVLRGLAVRGEHVSSSGGGHGLDHRRGPKRRQGVYASLRCALTTRSCMVSCVSPRLTRRVRVSATSTCHRSALSAATTASAPMDAASGAWAAEWLSA